ncbi:MAG: ABC transporter ATP-binding protein [Candidatus Berkelbacteria bacterium]|nr:ABC transporter ATP-binding protein [Candidatus Berkelbacteria bacterium]
MTEEKVDQTAAPKQTKGPMPGGRGVMGGPGMMGGAGEKAKNFKKTMANLFKYLKPFWFSIAIVFVFAIASTMFSIFSPKILGRVTNTIVDGYINRTVYDQVIAKMPAGVKIPAGTTGADILSKMPAAAISQIPADRLDKIKTLDLSTRPGIDFHSIASTAELLICLYLLAAFFSYLQGWIMTNVSQKITYNFRRDIAKKVGRMPLMYFDSRTHGEVLSRVTNDVDTVGMTLNQSLTQIVTSVTMIIGFLVMMLTISWQMTLVAITILPISMGIIGIIVSKSQKCFKGQQVSLGQLNGHVEEMYGGHNVMKVFNGEARSISKFKKINNSLYDSAWKSQFFSGLMWPIMNFLGNVGYVGVAVVGGFMAIRGRINIGDIQAFIQYMSQFNQPIMQTANVANVMQSTAAAAERVFEFLDEEDEIPEAENPVVLKQVKGDVEFENVVFGYNPDKKIIKNFNATVKSGQRVAIVGPTGAGKTTMVNLLMRFYDVNSGAIKIDGVDIRQMKRADLRLLFGMVLQDTWLFNGTIRDNIAYAKPDASEEEIIKAAKAAHVDHFVHSLPHGYDAELNEEADNVSEGEKQLLTIARAMLADPPMLILDEATSSVDTRTEILIQKAMDNLMKNRTSFVIAHRLSTIRDADLILVMKDGNIVEQGKHEELLKKNGFYADMYNSQFVAETAE